MHPICFSTLFLHFGLALSTIFVQIKLNRKWLDIAPLCNGNKPSMVDSKIICLLLEKMIPKDMISLLLVSLPPPWHLCNLGSTFWQSAIERLQCFPVLMPLFSIANITLSNMGRIREEISSYHQSNQAFLPLDLVLNMLHNTLPLSFVRCHDVHGLSLHQPPRGVASPLS